MIDPRLQAVVLAAGKSSRFNTSKSKLAHTICGLEMIAYPVKLLSQFTHDISLVVGYQKETIKEIMAKHHLPVTYAEQTTQAGTGHALLCTKDSWSKEYILVMNGDMPLVTEDIITQLLDAHKNSKAVMSFVTSFCDEPDNKYGKVIKKHGKVAIVEAKNLIHEAHEQRTSESRLGEELTRINAGMYLFDTAFLESTLGKITADSLTQEIYITDLAALAGERDLHVETISASFDTIRGVNTLKELWAAEHIKRSEYINHCMNNGVRFEAAQQVILEHDVTIEADTFIGAGVILRAGTRIEKNSTIEAFSILDNTHIGSNVTVHSHSSLSNCHIAENAQIGPFARIHKGSIVAEQAVIGNFVEVSKSIVGKKSKAKHLSYLGQAAIGNNVNIGAGTVICNYNGISKHETHIKDSAFIGSNTCLIAPVTIGSSSIIAAGSTITQPVPDNALAIARERQINKEEYAHKLKQKYIASTKVAIASI